MLIPILKRLGATLEPVLSLEVEEDRAWLIQPYAEDNKRMKPRLAEEYCACKLANFAIIRLGASGPTKVGAGFRTPPPAPVTAQFKQVSQIRLNTTTTLLQHSYRPISMAIERVHSH